MVITRSQCKSIAYGCNITIKEIAAQPSNGNGGHRFSARYEEPGFFVQAPGDTKHEALQNLAKELANATERGLVS